jgi:PIN domain nuclease of toxin-antitoxin system
MNSVVADTHALIWYLLEPQKLSGSALTALRQADVAREAIYVCSISMVEVRYLIEKGKLTEAVFQFITDSLNDVGTVLTLVPLDLNITQVVGQIPRNLVPDMPDRIIAATALHLNIPLITRDQKIQATGIRTIW